MTKWFAVDLPHFVAMNRVALGHRLPALTYDCRRFAA